jgi:K+-sensing histidine kinase KdpD
MKNLFIERPNTVAVRLAPVLVWGIALVIFYCVDDKLSLGNLALLMVLASAIASLWFTPTLSMLTSACAVGLFNWLFVSPRFTFIVDFQQDVILLITILVVSSVVSYLMELTRRAADREAKHMLQSQLAREHAQSHQLRNTLLTSISHDYRTPLSTVMSAASLIAEQAGRAPSEQLAQLANTILDEAKHLNRMTTNTLQLAKLDSRKVDIKLNWESVEEILGTVCLRARRSHPDRTVEIYLPNALPLVLCDAILLDQLFDNLIDNGLRHSSSDKPLHLIAHIQGQSLQMLVRDFGSGISDEWKNRVFDIFQRIDSPAVPVDGGGRRGIGVGLAVCRAIAQVHHGFIQITDTEGGGATVTLHLPLSVQPVMPAISGEVLA